MLMKGEFGLLDAKSTFLDYTARKLKHFISKTPTFVFEEKHHTCMKHKSQTAPLVIIEPESQHITFVQSELPQ